MNLSILLCGFGGQGILFAGKVIATAGLLEEKNVSWLPSYGPEMRGGTANCSVIVSDEDVGSPIVAVPDVLMAMNLPSLYKYENDVASGGLVVYDSTIIGRSVERSDVRAYPVPATRLATEMGAPTLANMVLLGKLISVCDELSYENIENALRSVVSAKHADLLEINLKAIRLGRDYEA